MTAAKPHAGDDSIAVLPMSPGAALSREQSQRATCLALALGLLRGRNVHVHAIRSIAEWLYTGETPNDRDPSS